MRLRESSLTAVLRVVDTMRASVNQTSGGGDHRARMLGTPLALVRLRVWLERASTAATPPVDNVSLHGDGVGPLSVKIGVVTQPDDGVLGVFIPATTPDGSNAHFRPTDADAAIHAVLNGLAEATSTAKVSQIYNKFVYDPAGADTTFPLDPSKPPLDLLLLVDIKGGVYVTSGILPRKKITLPPEFLAGALKKLEPTFRIGPVLALPDGTQSNPFLPTPAIAGYKCQWLEAGETKPEAMPPKAPDGVTPNARVSITEGWINLVSER